MCVNTGSSLVSFGVKKILRSRAPRPRSPLGPAGCHGVPCDGTAFAATIQATLPIQLNATRLLNLCQQRSAAWCVAVFGRIVLQQGGMFHGLNVN